MPSRGDALIHELAQDTPAARKRRFKIFNSMDPNGNNVLSLAEVQKFMRDVWPQYDKQRMLIRAFHAADTDGSELITRGEFKKLLKYIVFFNDLYDKFCAIDHNQDHRLDEAEFVKGCELIGGTKIKDPAKAFKAIDQNAGGHVLFDEFSVWIARKLCVDKAGVDDEMYMDAYHGSRKSIEAADGQKVRSGPWWKGRMKLKRMTRKSDPQAKKNRKKLYNRIDADGSKGVTPDEVFHAVQTMWPEFDSMEAVQSAFHAADRSNDGTIQFKEFRLLLKYLIFYDDAWEIFKALDTNADGKLQLAEFQKGIHMLDLKKSVSNPLTAYHAMNADGSDGVELDEFAAWLAEHSGRAQDMVDDAQRVMAAGDAAGGDDASLASLMNDLGIAAFIESLEAEDIKTISDLKCMEMSDLRSLGLTLGAARKLLNAAQSA